MRQRATGSGRGKRSAPPDLVRALGALRELYGRPSTPPIADPFALILYENVAYLASDARREEAFRILRERVGLSPEKILAAPQATLLEIARHGITPEKTAEKLREIARIDLEGLEAPLARIVRGPMREAKKALRQFPSIGEPGAEKILLFSKSQPILALDSNGLRVLLRLGFGQEDKNYAKSYRSAQEAAAPRLKKDCDGLIEARELLRRHGQELCKRTNPRCEICPLRQRCAYALSTRR